MHVPLLLCFLLPISLIGQDILVPNLIPIPVELRMDSGTCRLDGPWKVTGNGPEVLAIERVLAEELGAIRSNTDVTSDKTLTIALELEVFDTLVPHGYYSLRVTPTGISITSNSGDGLFWGTRTLIQILEGSRSSPEIQCLGIVDHPRFSWRGMHLDVCRHFFPVSFVKKYIDLLARYKMNSFHWHLTDDQGWRIEIKRYPKLTKVGGWRSGSQVGAYSRNEFDKMRYGGFYTQEEIREVVAYAAARHINVVPEIEMPGHALAALAAYPELGCTGGPYEVNKGWGVFEEVFCPSDSTIHFLENVLTEVMDLFPSNIIHIGGDECPKESWKKCPKCQARMQAEGLKDEHELQSYFIQRIEKFVNSKGRKIIGWDEILEGGLAPNAAVMSWRGTEGGVAAAKSGHDAVMSPGSHCYFDHYQGDPANEPLAIGGYTTVQKVYSYEPVPAELNSEEAKHILGAQGNVWTEYILTPEHVEYMALPRMAALAEVLWTPKEKRDEKDFLQRLEVELKSLERMKVNASRSLYAPSVKIEQGPSNGDISINVSRDLLVSDQVARLTGKLYFQAKGTDEDEVFEVIAKQPLIKGFVIRSSAEIEATFVDTTQKSNGSVAPIIHRLFYFNLATARYITLSEPPAEQYNTGGAFTLVDGISARGNRVNTEWLGWQKGVTATVDLGSEQVIKYIGIGALNDTYAWIHLPKSVGISTSTDGSTFIPVASVDKGIVDGIRTIYGTEVDAKARYVRFTVEHIGNIPEGFPGTGNPAWLFLDEVEVR